MPQQRHQQTDGPAPSQWWRKNWYNRMGWQHRRAYQLRMFPLCAMCLERGLAVAASVVDHIEPHRGDYTSFVLGKLQSLCEPCHVRHKHHLELNGYQRDVGLDGWPTDPNHPANQTSSSTANK